MSSQGFRHRENEEWKGMDRPERQAAREVSPEEAEQGQAPSAPSSPASPCSASKAPLFPEAIDLGSAASLFRIAGSQTHPNPQSAVEALRQRMKKSLEEGEKSRLPSRVTLRDMATTTDSLWIPALKAILALLICALVAAGVYGVIEWLQPASMEPVAAAGAAIAFFF